MVMVVEVDKGYEQLLLWHILLHGLPHYMLIQAIGFTHLSFHAVAVDGVVEVSFRHAHQYLCTGFAPVFLVDGHIHHA